ncbi:hypothetical protein LR48_Vigan04g129000 [Vigna angularis]|uniref:Uncharacterized protein n=1 Tax=Phaseolus angularis TaxID=3914 RepID=A0A0L9UEW8_PHAAN|nr:hypothetical protein LR48_Vigan04g129000 [Vigna angularis]
MVTRFFMTFTTMSWVSWRLASVRATALTRRWRVVLVLIRRFRYAEVELRRRYVTVVLILAMAEAQSVWVWWWFLPPMVTCERGRRCLGFSVQIWSSLAFGWRDDARTWSRCGFCSDLVLLQIWGLILDVTGCRHSVAEGFAGGNDETKGFAATLRR